MPVNFNCCRRNYVRWDFNDECKYIVEKLKLLEVVIKLQWVISEFWDFHLIYTTAVSISASFLSYLQNLVVLFSVVVSRLKYSLLQPRWSNNARLLFILRSLRTHTANYNLFCSHLRSMVCICIYPKYASRYQQYFVLMLPITLMGTSYGLVLTLCVWWRELTPVSRPFVVSIWIYFYPYKDSYGEPSKKEHWKNHWTDVVNTGQIMVYYVKN